MEPLISIMIPVYNVEAYLPRCLDSVLAQTYANLEIILINDGSLDRSGTICDQYAMKDSRIRVIHKDNEGVAAARNTGLGAANGEYLMFVDSDDYISGDAVQVLYNALIRDGSDMAIGKHTDVYEDGTENDDFCRWMTDRVYTGREVLEMMGDIERPAVVSWGKLYSKKVMDGVCYPMLACGEDLWMFPTILEGCGRISIVNNVIYYYYHRPTSILHRYNSRAGKDNLTANLHVTQYFWKHGYAVSAKKWYGNSVDRAFQYGNLEDCNRIINAYFDKSTSKQLFIAQGMRIKLKWIALHFPHLRLLLYWLKKRRHR